MKQLLAKKDGLGVNPGPFTMTTLTQERLKELLHYDPDTGIFTWLVSRGCIKKGSTAGNKQPSGYIYVRIEGKLHAAHRLAFLYMVGSFPVDEGGHENGTKDDNVWSNLEDVTHADNMKNRKVHNNNTSGTTGVSFNKTQVKWQAIINIDGEMVRLGSFDDEQEAIDVRKAAEVEHGFHKNHGRAA